jgi:hypothetical protein
MLQIAKGHPLRACVTPLGRNAIANEWVFKVRVKLDASFSSFEVRMVAQGFIQGAKVRKP